MTKRHYGDEKQLLPGSLDRTRDRNALVLFFGLATVFCTGAYVPMLTGAGFDALGGYALTLLMWSPGLAGVITSLVMYRSLAPLGLTGNRRALYWIMACIALPIVYALAIKGGLAAAGVIGLASGSLPTSLLFTGLFLSLRNALGEELGWRGFAAPVLTRLFGFWRGQTLLGLFWFLFHLPALLGTSYGSSPHPLFGNLMFFLTCMSLSYFLGWARLQSDSVWPSALFHASHNLYFLHLFEPVEVRAPSASFLIGEQGLLCAAVQIALSGFVLWAWRRQALVSAT
jgi:uncharacterized protein